MIIAMTPSYPTDYLIDLVRELCKQSSETEWIEFKVNNANPQRIGEYISALANSAAFYQKVNAYMVWGVQNGTHEIVGTNFNPFTTKKGNEPLENWLLRFLEPRMDFRFFEIMVDEKPVVILEVDSASHKPVAFSGIEYIRIGASKKDLKECPEKERALWRVFDVVRFEKEIAVERIKGDAILHIIDYTAYFNLLKIPIPNTRETILGILKQEELIVPNDASSWNITNLGAILFARDLKDFPHLKRKALRISQYFGNSKTVESRTKEIFKGYAVGFDLIIDSIESYLVNYEVVERIYRKEIRVFPAIAIRELVANALIHQDFLMRGTGPEVEIFDDRIEITNPGAPLVEVQRILDYPPVSRNEALVSLMRRFDLCEERGIGIDKVVEQIEYSHLPSPKFEIFPNHTRVVLFGPKSVVEMSDTERLQACYMHASLKYVQKGALTISSLQERFGLDEKSKATVSHYIHEAVEAGLIKPMDKDASQKDVKYVPYWA